jgi:hypothetical protein
MTDHSGMKLGKLPPRIDPRTLRMAHYLKPLTKKKMPSAVKWSAKMTAPWGMMGNDTIGDCTCAAAGHMEEVWTASASALYVPSDQDIINAYSAITGYTPNDPNMDQGAVMLDVLNFWHNKGIGQRKIQAFASVSVAAELEVKQCILLFGGVNIGLALPIAAQQQGVWDVTQGPNSVPGSWGGHDVPVLDYDDQGLTCVTWGQLKRMTWDFWHKYVDEAYAILSPDWIKANGVSAEGVALTTLLADLEKIH